MRSKRPNHRPLFRVHSFYWENTGQGWRRFLFRLNLRDGSMKVDELTHVDSDFCPRCLSTDVRNISEFTMLCESCNTLTVPEDT